ncbi:PREDICTED: uncharacterized protein LOC109586390 isoform X2 [Amphimedon queenslandica]|uniref:BEN domain-containing protein n=1 Tax=Amphimedon queenslandica TaxID=400682 RepID=A0A1X7TRJ4_AMPQE|nr:PREDICTED: uncharacterized protein LOC109586390 isoform X2 [Amphimedon queenslandica]|eukprot:XP_019858135.1 PREDICTED: uncharacterized protein LOC109586390 isoform X2 [Amphimedon queenslandica]
MMSKSSKRQRKPSEKVKVSGDDGVEQQLPAQTMWCTVKLENKDGSEKEHLVCSKYLENEDGSQVTLKDLYSFNNVIWVHRKVPYEVTIMETHVKKPTKRRIVDELSHSDSSSDESEEIPERPLKKQKSDEKITEYIPSDNEVETVSQDSAGSLDVQDSVTTPVASHLTQDSTSSPMINGFKVPFATPTHSTNATPNGSGKVTPILNQSTVTTPKAGSQRKYDRDEDVKDRLTRIEKKLDKLITSVSTSTGRIVTDNNDEASSTDATNKKYITDSGVNLLTVRAETPSKYALSLMDIFFTEMEMANSCYCPSKRTKKPPLNSDKVAFLEECIRKKFSIDIKEFEEKYGSVIRRKCMQKCLDKNRTINGIKKE